MVQPSAQTIEKSARAIDDGSDIDRVSVYLQAHLELHNLCWILKHYFVEEGPFCWTYGVLPLANKHIDSISENMSAVNGLLVG